MKKENKILIIEFTIALFIVICLTSCGARKVQKSETKENESKSELVSETINTDTNENVKVIDSSTTDEFEIVPIDNTKEIIVNGKSYKNVKIKHKKNKNNISVVKDVKVQHNAQKSDLKTVKTNKVVEVKQIQRENNYFWLFWLLILIPIYFVYKKYKDYI